MWIFSKTGFFSVIQDEKDVTKVWVRARAREDLAALGLGKIIATPEADYAFRCRVTKLKWADKMLELSLAIDYPNFKGAVPKRKKLYSEVWMTMRSLGPIPPYGTKGYELRHEVSRKFMQDTDRRQKNEGHRQANQPRKGIRFHPGRQR